MLDDEKVHTASGQCKRHLLGLKEILEVLLDVCRREMGCWGPSCAEAVNTCTDIARTATRPALLGFLGGNQGSLWKRRPRLLPGLKHMACGLVQAASARPTRGPDGTLALVLGLELGGGCLRVSTSYLWLLSSARATCSARRTAQICCWVLILVLGRSALKHVGTRCNGGLSRHCR